MKQWLILGSLSLSSLGIHLLTFLIHGPHPLGYDTGFYRRYLIEPFTSFPNAPVPGLGDLALLPRIILDLGRLTQLPPDTILYGAFILCIIATPPILFICLRNHVGTLAAYLASTLLVFSSVSYDLYWFMLFKQAFALPLFILALFALAHKKYILFILASASILLSHTTTSLFFLLFLIAYIPHIRPLPKTITLGYYALFAAGLILLAFFPTLLFKVPPQGFFLSWSEFLLLAFPLFIVILLAGKALIKNSIHPVWNTLLFLSLLFPLLHLPFYERIFIFTDLALVIFAGVALAHLVTHIQNNPRTIYTYIQIIGIVLTTFFILGNLIYTIQTRTPLIPAETLSAISKLNTQLPEGTLLLTSSIEAPWYMGWTNAHIAAPGMLRDTHTQEEWEEVWNNPNPEKTNAFLSTFPQPLYISTFNPLSDLIGTHTPCIHNVQNNLFLFFCK